MLAPMCRTSTYVHLTVAEIHSYLKGRPELAHGLDLEHMRDPCEVGDGNWNLVFVARDHRGRGVVLKQALPYVRVAGPSWPFTPTRANAEARAYTVHGSVAREFVPRLYGFDQDRYVLAIEDLSDHEVWRTALNNGSRDDGVASAIGRYVARVAFGTSTFALGPEEHRRRAAEAANPEMCSITEQLVFTEPYVGHKRNDFLKELGPDVERLRGDARLLGEVARLRHRFVTGAEALVHGDLHSGSVMIRRGPNGTDSVKAIDSEFAFYGPVAFDLGCVLGNCQMALSRAIALGDSEHAAWTGDLVAQTWDGFEVELRALWPQRIEPTVCNDKFLDGWLSRVRSEAIGFAGTEIVRRTIGYAHVSDWETLPAASRLAACRAQLCIGHWLIAEAPALSIDRLVMETERRLREQ